MIERIPEQLSSDNPDAQNYLNIRAEKDMTVQETNDFIENEFKSSYKDIDEILFDQLLSEVYNRSEEEIDIDFKVNDRMKSIVDQIYSDEWKNLSETDKCIVIDGLIESIAKELGMDSVPTSYLSDLPYGEYGFFSREKNAIVINSQLLNEPYDLISTVAHETRHAYQHMRAEKLETREDALYRINFDNYIEVLTLPDGSCLFFFDYYSQYVEVDARAFANSFMEAMR